MYNSKNIFEELGLPREPIFLAPLAGVSDIPFRRVCAERGASLTYVEMLSATALIYNSKRTFEMLQRHSKEQKLGVQITAKNPEEMGKAVEILNDYAFETVDLNMGCPVRKVVNTGCGSAVIKDPELAYKITKAAVEASKYPVSVKYRLGWDHDSLNYLEVAEALESAGARWITIHGRTRSDDYSKEVNLEAIKEIKDHVEIPVIGNGNIFSLQDFQLMKKHTNVDGIMVSRGALGNPWVFEDLSEQKEHSLSREDWRDCVLSHLQYQEDAYGESSHAVVTMRKHLLWYLKGWPGSKAYKETFMTAMKFSDIYKTFDIFCKELEENSVSERTPLYSNVDSRFHWNPNREMDRQADSAVFEA